MKRIVIVLICLFLASCQPSPRACFDSDCFKLEVVDTPESRQQGMMDRESLPDNQGMFFVFESVGNYPFWMKNTLIPLDIIWLDWENKVVFIQEYAVPCEKDPCFSYDPKTDAKFVLEINGGLSREKGIKVGDVAVVDY